MKYDLMHLSGPPDAGCGETYVDNRLDDDHEKGDRVSILCEHCGRVGLHEVRGRLVGFER